MKKYCKIAVNVPVDGGPFTYEIPSALSSQVMVGSRVLVPFGARTLTGYVLELTSTPDVEKTKLVRDVLDARPLYSKKLLDFYRWMSEYYHARLGQALSLAHPASANVMSVRAFKATAGGMEALEEKKELSKLSKVDAEILEATKKSVKLSTLIKRLKGKPLYSAIEGLKKAGLVAEEIILSGGAGVKTERVVRVIKGKIKKDSESLGRSKKQLEIFLFLLNKKEVLQKDLRKEFKNIDAPLKALREKELIEIKDIEVSEDPFEGVTLRDSEHEPNKEQAKALLEINQSLIKGFSPFLLYGITGSGKTLVYIKAIEEALRIGKKALFLVPEIALTGRAAGYLAHKFPGKVALLHSALSESERYFEWRRILRGEVDVVIGARSALFSPIKDLGLIVVDEEHDPSYKQEEGIRYNARDLSLVLGKMLGATVILGSATPSVETFYNSETGKIKRINISERVKGGELPCVEIEDMRGSRGVVLSPKLMGLIEGTFKEGHQSLLFLNRRGYSTSLLCTDCGAGIECENCAVTLTLHKKVKKLKCHYCDHSIALPSECPVCKGEQLREPGVGTEKVEGEVLLNFPEMVVGRLDRDTSKKKGATQRILDAMENRKLDCLVGTQMVGKGHHFPAVTLVGIINADISLNIPDFRGSERTFQLISQAAGRAGRDRDVADAEARVIVQTLNPSHFCFKAAVAHDYVEFFSEEIKNREESEYPPFVRLTLLRVQGEREIEVSKAIDVLKQEAKQMIKNGYEVTVLGPAPALIARLRGRYRWQILLKAKNAKVLSVFVKTLKDSFNSKPRKGLSLIVDVDPSVTV
ncbi:MAG: primosomal protein N' [Deltaproteobacteria bacterium]|nr:primosomal protein N' [Deltaproteobacteria bacterium]